jgi:hypothetical protein
MKTEPRLVQPRPVTIAHPPISLFEQTEVEQGGRFLRWFGQYLSHHREEIETSQLYSCLLTRKIMQQIVNKHEWPHPDYMKSSKLGLKQVPGYRDPHEMSENAGHRARNPL